MTGVGSSDSEILERTSLYDIEKALDKLLYGRACEFDVWINAIWVLVIIKNDSSKNTLLPRKELRGGQFQCSNNGPLG